MRRLFIVILVVLIASPVRAGMLTDFDPVEKPLIEEQERLLEEEKAKKQKQEEERRRQENQRWADEEWRRENDGRKVREEQRWQEYLSYERSGALKVGVYSNGMQNAETIEFEGFLKGGSFAFRILQLDYDITEETNSGYSEGTYSEKGSGKGGGATIRFFEEGKGPYYGFGLNFYFVNYSSIDKPDSYTTNSTNNASATAIDINVEVGYKMLIFNTIQIEPALLLGAYGSSSGGGGGYILPGLSLGIRF